MLAFLFISQARAVPAAPAVSFVASPRGATVSVVAPAGYKLAADAPWMLSLTGPTGGAEVRGSGHTLASPVPIPGMSGAISGSLDVGLCTLDGTSCAPTHWQVTGELPTARRVRQALSVEVPQPPVHPFGPDATADALDEALARAATSGKMVLVDFSAAWCPPCNQLAAELLHAAVPDPVLDGYEVVVLDADHPSSFPAKDRFDVGGYPSVLVLGPDGAERTRIVGYPGLEAMRTWLAAAPTSADARDLAAGPAAADGPRAAALAWTLAFAGKTEDAAAWLARAVETGADTPERHLAALALDPDPRELQWILDHAPERSLDAAPLAVDLAEKEPAVVLALCDAAAPLARGTQLADLLELRAAAVPAGPERLALLRGAAAVLVARSTGNPALDKPHLTWLAALYEQSEQPEAAVALLEDASARWPDEPTYDLPLAPLLVRLGRPDQALVVAERALARAWGDNHLRAVAAQARVLQALGRDAEARDVAAAELLAVPAPPVGTNPRTDRYRATLQRLADGTDPR